jgi:hypothetical protein
MALRLLEKGWHHVCFGHLARKSRPLISAFPASVNWAPAEFALGDALEPGSLEIVSLDAPLGGGPLREQPLEHALRDPDHAVVLADLDPELHGLPIGIPAGILGERWLGNGVPQAILATDTKGRRRRTLGRTGEMINPDTARPPSPTR